MAHKDLPRAKVNFAIVITSDSRTEKTDRTGKVITNLLERQGHKCVIKTIIPNNLKLIQRHIKDLIRSVVVQLVITSGGTGCGNKDVTIEAIAPLLSKTLEGFGELFRMLSYKEIGSTALMSRAFLGIAGQIRNCKPAILCALPGSPDAVKLALSKLLIPQIDHLIWELGRS
ncbi:MAG: MogA/MoaB family molybdenum cofactor biosynthesis protein [Planctomycetes bacterium]|nr:MogA/MoaB family molybdenum cofactor biosynthesis protein [Planctomycetota bacterium]